MPKVSHEALKKLRLEEIDNAVQGEIAAEDPAVVSQPEGLMPASPSNASSLAGLDPLPEFQHTAEHPIVAKEALTSETKSTTEGKTSELTEIGAGESNSDNSDASDKLKTVELLKSGLNRLSTEEVKDLFLQLFQQRTEQQTPPSPAIVDDAAKKSAVVAEVLVTASEAPETSGVEQASVVIAETGPQRETPEVLQEGVLGKEEEMVQSESTATMAVEQSQLPEAASTVSEDKGIKRKREAMTASGVEDLGFQEIGRLVKLLRDNPALGQLLSNSTTTTEAIGAPMLTGKIPESSPFMGTPDNIRSSKGFALAAATIPPIFRAENALPVTSVASCPRRIRSGNPDDIREFGEWMAEMLRSADSYSQAYDLTDAETAVFRNLVDEFCTQVRHVLSSVALVEGVEIPDAPAVETFLHCACKLLYALCLRYILRGMPRCVSSRYDRSLKNQGDAKNIFDFMRTQNNWMELIRKGQGTHLKTLAPELADDWSHTTVFRLQGSFACCSGKYTVHPVVSCWAGKNITHILDILTNSLFPLGKKRPVFIPPGITDVFFTALNAALDRQKLAKALMKVKPSGTPLRNEDGTTKGCVCPDLSPFHVTSFVVEPMIRMARPYRKTRERSLTEEKDARKKKREPNTPIEEDGWKKTLTPQRLYQDGKKKGTIGEDSTTRVGPAPEEAAHAAAIEEGSRVIEEAAIKMVPSLVEPLWLPHTHEEDKEVLHEETRTIMRAFARASLGIDVDLPHRGVLNSLNSSNTFIFNEYYLNNYKPRPTLHREGCRNCGCFIDPQVIPQNSPNSLLSSPALCSTCGPRIEKHLSREADSRGILWEALPSLDRALAMCLGEFSLAQLNIAGRLQRPQMAEFWRTWSDEEDAEFIGELTTKGISVPLKKGVSIQDIVQMYHRDRPRSLGANWTHPRELREWQLGKFTPSKSAKKYESEIWENIKAYDELKTIHRIPCGEEHEYVLSNLNAVLSGTKVRPIFDLRWDNGFLSVPKFSLPSLHKCRHLFKRDAWMTKFDLKSAYHHGAMTEEAKKLLGFRAPDGSPWYFDVLPFGLASAPHDFQRLMMVLGKKWKKEGMTTIIYLDDILLISLTRREVEEEGKTILEDLREAGFLLSSKSELWPTQVTEFLGIIINTIAMTFSPTIKRWDALWKGLAELCSKAFQLGRWSRREVARSAGRLTSLSVAMGQTALLTARSLSAWLYAENIKSLHWDEEVEVLYQNTETTEGMSLEELARASPQGVDFQGALIAIFQLAAIFEAPMRELRPGSGWELSFEVPTLPEGQPVEATKVDPDETVWLFSDASDIGVGAALVLPEREKKGQEPLSFFQEVNFIDTEVESLRGLDPENWITQIEVNATSELKSLSRGLLTTVLGSFSSLKAELVALLRALQAFERYIEGRTVVWVTDSLSACFVLMKGSRCRMASRIASIITSLATAKGVAIIMHWAERDWNQSADALSKPTKDLRFCFSPRAFAVLLTIWKKNYAFVPNIDLFATRANALCNRFVTKTADPHATALDAFTLARAGEGWAAWMYPNWNVRVLESIPPLVQRLNCMIALLLPSWAEDCLKEIKVIARQNSRGLGVVVLKTGMKWQAVDPAEGRGLTKAISHDALVVMLSKKGKGLESLEKQLSLEDNHVPEEMPSLEEFPEVQVALQRRVADQVVLRKRIIEKRVQPFGGDALPIIGARAAPRPMMGIDGLGNPLPAFVFPKEKERKDRALSGVSRRRKRMRMSTA